jgi:glycosyltransferase involved in cell wall biosynthesis
MWFDIPILAYRSTAVPETLGDAALMFTDKGDLDAVAAMASLLLCDRTLRQRLIDAQRRRRAQFLPEQIRPLLFHLLGQLWPSNVAQPDLQRR